MLRDCYRRTGELYQAKFGDRGLGAEHHKAVFFNDPLTDDGVHLQLFRLQGEGVEWSPDGKWVVYDCKHRDGYYNIHVCRADGTQDRSLTTLNNGLPHRHAGSPTWHPTGRYIAFAAEKKVHQGGSVEAIPGFGGRSDIWVMLADGSKAWRLTQTEDIKSDGVLLPKFTTAPSWRGRSGLAPRNFSNLARGLANGSLKSQILLIRLPHPN
jgi:Tol biopolymer transport system component